MKTITITFNDGTEPDAVLLLWRALRTSMSAASDYASPEVREAIKQSNWTIDMSPDKSLADDLADVLAHTVVGWESIIGHDLAQAPEVQRVMKRFREATKQ